MAKAAELNDDHEHILPSLCHDSELLVPRGRWLYDLSTMCGPSQGPGRTRPSVSLSAARLWMHTSKYMSLPGQLHFQLRVTIGTVMARNCRHYNVPNSRQGLAAIISGDIDALLNTRDIIIRYRGGVLCTTEVHPPYVAPRSPLLSPTGQPSLSLEMWYTCTASAVWRKILSGQVPSSTQGLIGKLSHYKQTLIPTFPISHRLGLDHIPSEIKWQGDSLGVSTTAHASRSGRRRPQKERPEYTRANRNPEDDSPTPSPSIKQRAKRKVSNIGDAEAAGAEEKGKLRKDDGA